MSKRDPKILLLDIFNSIEKIKVYVSGYDFNSFVEDSKTADPFSLEMTKLKIFVL